MLFPDTCDRQKPRCQAFLYSYDDDGAIVQVTTRFEIGYVRYVARCTGGIDDAPIRNSIRLGD